MGGVVFGVVRWLDVPPEIEVIVGVVVGIATYVALAARNRELWETVRWLRPSA
jgi:hypothetical protein